MEVAFIITGGHPSFRITVSVVFPLSLEVEVHCQSNSAEIANHFCHFAKVIWHQALKLTDMTDSVMLLLLFEHQFPYVC